MKSIGWGFAGITRSRPLELFAFARKRGSGLGCSLAGSAALRTRGDSVQPGVQRAAAIVRRTICFARGRGQEMVSSKFLAYG